MKWRPSKLNCLYVIPDIHGAARLLDNILARILPLRKSDGGQDKIVFLGDYIDRHKDSHKVIDKLIELKTEYKDNVILLWGNHELMLLESFGYLKSKNIESTYDMWQQTGGYSTVLGYMERNGIDENPSFWTRTRIKELIPKEHIDFLIDNLVAFYEEDNFVFVHGGYDPLKKPSEFGLDVLAWDRSLFKLAQLLVGDKKELPWPQTIVTGHNVKGGTPFINEKFMMLDCGSPGKLLVVEMRSLEAFMAYPNKKRLVKYELKETIINKAPSLIKRVT